MKPVLALAFTLLLGTAPFQCANDPEPEERLEDTPAEALFNLAAHFHDQNQEEARRETLRQIIDQYPSSVEAHQAQLILDGHELTPEPTSGSTESASGTAPATGTSTTGGTTTGTTPSAN